MKVSQITSNKKKYLNLLLLADEKENMIDRYLERGEVFVLHDSALCSIAVVTDEGDGICELKNLATAPEHQRQGYAKQLVQFLFKRYAQTHRMMLVGTGGTPAILSFYKSCGFVYSHRVPDFFTKNYTSPIVEDGVTLRDMVYLKKAL